MKNLDAVSAPEDVATKAYVDSKSGVTDHGALTGLADDDHPQYVKDTGDIMTGNLEIATNAGAAPVPLPPTTESHLRLRRTRNPNSSAGIQINDEAGTVSARIYENNSGLTVQVPGTVSDLTLGTEATWPGTSAAYSGHIALASGQIKFYANPGIVEVNKDPTTPLGVATKQMVDGKVAKTGDTMTGPLTVNSPIGASSVGVQSPPGYYSSFVWRKDDVTRRWAWEKDNTTETGGNAGSDLYLVPSADAGQMLPKALTFTRSTSLGTVAGDPTAPLGIATKQYSDRPWPNECRFGLGTINFVRADGKNVAWVAITGSPAAFYGSVQITLTTGWNYLAGYGRHTKQTDFYWDGAMSLYMISDRIIEASNSPNGGISNGYAIGAPIVDSNRVLWPVQRNTPTIGEEIHVSVSVMVPGAPSDGGGIRNRFVLYPPEAGPLYAGTQGASDWVSLGLMSGWVNYDARTARVRRTMENQIILSGVVRSGTVGAPICNLPPSYRPVRGGVDLPVTVATGLATLNIASNGDVTLISSTAGGNPTSYTYLDCSFAN